MIRPFYILFFLFALNFILLAHPLKMAYTAVKYNSYKKVFEVQHRVFQDDFELTLREKYGYKGADVFLSQSDRNTIQVINSFFGKNFSLDFNGKKQHLKFIRIEQKNQMGILVCYETEKISWESVKTFTVYNTIMMESFKEQFNLFNININDVVKKTISFEVGNTRKTEKI